MARWEEIPAFKGQPVVFLVFDRKRQTARGDNGSEPLAWPVAMVLLILRRLDEDRNGWIENDPAWRQLAVWSGSGFASLAERQVGALYTGAVDALVYAQGRRQRTAGQIRAAGSTSPRAVR